MYRCPGITRGKFSQQVHRRGFPGIRVRVGVKTRVSIRVGVSNRVRIRVSVRIRVRIRVGVRAGVRAGVRVRIRVPVTIMVTVTVAGRCHRILPALPTCCPLQPVYLDACLLPWKEVESIDWW